MSLDPMPHRSQAARPRRDDLDFWRGVLFCTIFINHVPGNVFETLTQKNYGFSDSAEAFVFVSGLSLALAYGSRFASGEWRNATLSIVRRALMLYAIHVALSLAGLAIFGAGAVFGDKPDLLRIHGRALFVDNPVEGLIGLLSLGHQLGYFNILPMYVLMLVIAPVLLWIGRKSIAAMLAVAGLVYVSTRLYGWNLPTWPDEGLWFFDPLAWQFMLALGLACGLAATREPLGHSAVPRSWPLAALALIVVLLSAVSVTNAFSYQPSLQDWTRSWADLDKTNLGMGRIIHFLSFAYLLYMLRIVDLIRGFSLFRLMCLTGRGGIWMFSLLSLLAAVGQVSMSLMKKRLSLDVVLICGGLAILFAAAHHLQALRRQTKTPPPAVAAMRPLRAR